MPDINDDFFLVTIELFHLIAHSTSYGRHPCIALESMTIFSE
jgi:hypothetical protein